MKNSGDSSNSSSFFTSRRFLLKTAVQKALAQMRLWFTLDPGKEGNQELEQVEAQALTQAGSRLKAGVAKMAQLMGYWEHLDGFAGAAKQALASLFDRIPGASEKDIENVITLDLGAPPTALFAIWTKEPFAAASLGEVHLAMGHDHIEYAVKVQYPGIEAALQTDVENPELLDRLVGGTMGTFVSNAAKQTLKNFILLELDYGREAKNLAAFSAAFSDETNFVFPTVNLALSSHRILTATKLQGEPLLGFLLHADQQQRTNLAILLFQFGFGAPLVHGLLNADPNPGNFLVIDQGKRLGLLDFGSCVELTEDQMTFERVFWQSLLAGDAEVMRYTLFRMGFARHAQVFDSDEYRIWEAFVSLPYATHHFHFTTDYAKALVQHTETLVQQGYFTPPADFFLLFRQRLGLASILGLCDGQADFRNLLLEMLQTVGMAPKGIR